MQTLSNGLVLHEAHGRRMIAERTIMRFVLWKSNSFCILGDLHTRWLALLHTTVKQPSPERGEGISQHGKRLRSLSYYKTSNWKSDQNLLHGSPSEDIAVLLCSISWWDNRSRYRGFIVIVLHPALKLRRPGPSRASRLLKLFLKNKEKSFHHPTSILRFSTAPLRSALLCSDEYHDSCRVFRCDRPTMFRR